jgi:regulator of cell morphogenesis and NO signaling
MTSIQPSQSPVNVVEFSPQTAHVFRRYEIDIDSRKSIKNWSGNTSFLLDILNCFHQCKDASIKDFELYQVPVLVDYLQRSHRYYIEQRLPELEEAIWGVYRTHCLNNRVLKILYEFFELYREDLESHFEYEEKYLFPYSKLLHQEAYYCKYSPVAAVYISQFSAAEFVATHDDMKADAKVIQDALLSFKADENLDPSVAHVLNLLKDFQHDLAVHGKIEDHVLVPKLMNMEMTVKARLN